MKIIYKDRLKFFFQHGVFVLRSRYTFKFFGSLRRIYYLLQGMKIESGTTLPKFYITWPHQVSIGKGCTLEPNIYFKYDGIWKNGPNIIIADRVFIGCGCEFNIRLGIQIGEDSLIASGCRFIDHDHGISLNELVRSQNGPEQKINIGKDVWLGCNAIILKGVIIGDGAIVAAGAVVNKSILENEIWAGVPAKKIGKRILK